LKLAAQMIEVIGEAIAGREPGVSRAAARAIIELDCFTTSVKNTDDLTHLMRVFEEIENHWAHPSRYLDQALLRELEPYPSTGILFSVQVSLLRIEKYALGCGWLPEQLRALGLAINHGEQLIWLIDEWAEIKERDGSIRRFYR
jgi:hypothetical protein